MPPKPNAFMCFCMEWKSKYGKRMSMQEATAEAGKIWKDMSSHDRAPYTEKAKTKRQGSGQRQGQREEVKYTCTGRTLTEVSKEKEHLENKERRMKRFIESTVRRSVKDNTLLTQRYYFIKVNYFVKTVNDYYIPAEVAVSEFSLRNGVSRTYHAMINPGREIFGHHYDAIAHSQETHKLPLPPNAMGNKNLGEVFNDILRFIYDDDTESYGPIYTPREEMPIVESILNFLQADPNAREAEIDLHSLQYLLFILKDVACEINDEEKIESYHIIEAFIDNDFFEYQSGISCNYHEENDNSKHCALSCVVRWGYAFCDLLCKHLAVDLIPGRHCPAETDLNAIIIEPNKSQSVKRGDIQREKGKQGNNNNFKSESNASSFSYADVASGSSTSLAEDKSFKQYKKDNRKNNYNNEEYPKLGTGFQRQRYAKREDDRQSQSSSDSNAFIRRDNKIKRGSSPSAPGTYAYNNSDSDEYTADTASRDIWSQRCGNIPPTPDSSYFDFESTITSERGFGRGSRQPKREYDEYPENGIGRGGCPF